MGKVKRLLKGLVDFLSGKHEITFYFQTLNFMDSLLALWYSLAVLLGLQSAKHGRRDFIMKIQERFGYGHVFLYGSARSALYAILKALELPEDAEVLITGFTCEVVPNAVIQAGCKPVYVDIDRKTFGTSAASLEERITDKCRALIMQHSFGIPANIGRLLEIARQRGLYVVEDCAVSLGSFYRGRPTGTFGDAAIFSFELSKTITSCRGGMLVINTTDREQVLKHQQFYNEVTEQRRIYSTNILFQLGICGILYQPVIYNIGKFFISLMYKVRVFKRSTCELEKEAKISDDYLVKLSDQQAMILLRQLGRLEKICNQSNEICLEYYESLRHIRHLRPFPYKNEQQLNLIRYPIESNFREELVEIFRENGIELGLWFTAPLSSPAIKQELFGYESGSCPVAEDVAGQICNLPTHLRVRPRDVARISMLMKSVRE